MNFCLSVSRFPFFPYPLLRTHSLLLGWVRPHAKSGKLRRPRRAYTEAPQQSKTVPIPPTTRKHRAWRDRGFISAPTACGVQCLPRRLPLRDAGRGAASVVCVVSRFPPSLTLIAAAASSAISLKARLTAQEGRSPAGFAQIETLPKVMRTPLVCAGQQTGSRASNASPPGTG